MKLITITIPNWEKYNERSDRKNHTWFRFQNDFFHDQRVFGLTAEQKLVYTLLLCECGKKGGESFDFSTDYAAAVLRMDSQTVSTALIVLKNNDLIESADISQADDGVCQEKVVLQTDRQTDRQDRQLPRRRAAGGSGSEVWESYATAYETRYGEKPVRNAKQNTHCKQLVDRIGGDAVEVAAFYVRHDNAYYQTRGHPLALAVGDAEKLRTEWKTGAVTTAGQARSREQQSGTVQAIRAHYAKKHGGVPK